MSSMLSGFYVLSSMSLGFHVRYKQARLLNDVRISRVLHDVVRISRVFYIVC